MENVKSEVFSYLAEITKGGADIISEKEKIVNRLAYRYKKPYATINGYVNNYIKSKLKKYKETNKLYVGQRARILKTELRDCKKYKEYTGWINYITKYNVGVAINAINGSYIESFSFNSLEGENKKALQVFEDGEWKKVVR